MKEKSSMAAAIYKTITIMGLLCLQRLVTAELTTAPKDSEALDGTLTFFNCSSTLPASSIHWFHYDIGAQDDRYIVYGYDQIHGSFQNRFRVERDDAARKSNLVIERVSAADAGKFECQDDMGRGASGFAQLSVLDAKPVCEWKIDNQQLSDSRGDSIKSEEFLHLKCTVDFRGNNPPKMIWKRSGSNEAITEGITLIRDSTNRITYRLDMASSHEFDGQSFQCETTKSVTTQLACLAGPVVIEANTGKAADNPKIVGLSVALALVSILAIVLLVLCLKLWLNSRKKRRTGPDTIQKSYPPGAARPDPGDDPTCAKQPDQSQRTRYEEKIQLRPAQASTKQPDQSQRTRYEEKTQQRPAQESTSPQKFDQPHLEATQEKNKGSIRQSHQNQGIGLKQNPDQIQATPNQVYTSPKQPHTEPKEEEFKGLEPEQGQKRPPIKEIGQRMTSFADAHDRFEKNLPDKTESDDEEPEQQSEEHQPLVSKANGSQLRNQSIGDVAQAEAQTSKDNESALQSVSESLSPDKTSK